jgi:hypothetical protein
MAPEINNYITKRYERWLDYSKYKCSKAELHGQEYDVLDEVLLNILKKDEQFLLKLINTKKVQKGVEYSEFDFFLLRAIDLNVNSETSPYRHKNKPIPRANVEVSRLKILDLQEEETDHAGYVLDRMHQIRNVIDEMGFSEKAMAIFEFKFFNDEKFGDWPGPETKRELYCIYSRITKILNAKIHGRLLV